MDKNWVKVTVNRGIFKPTINFLDNIISLRHSMLGNVSNIFETGWKVYKNKIIRKITWCVCFNIIDYCDYCESNQPKYHYYLFDSFRRILPDEKYTFEYKNKINSLLTLHEKHIVNWNIQKKIYPSYDLLLTLLIIFAKFNIAREVYYIILSFI